MKKFFLSVVTLMSISLISEAQLKVGIKAGGNLSTQHRNDATTSKLVSNDAFRGYHAGLVADIKVIGNLYLQPQVLYTQKGVKYKNLFSNADAKLTMKSVEVPVSIIYKAEMTFGKLFAGAGPVISYGFGGQLKQNGAENKIYKGNGKMWEHIDISAAAVAGLELNNGLFASVNYQRGFKDVYKSDLVEVKNRSLSVSVGYLIDWNRITGKK